MENSQTEPADSHYSSGFRSFPLWLSWHELTSRRIVFALNVIIIALLISLPLTLDFVGKARKGSVDKRIDYLGPSLSLVPKGIRSSDLVTAQLKGLTFSQRVHDNIRREVSAFLRASEARLITRLPVDGRNMPVVGIDFGDVHSYPFSLYSPPEDEILLGEIAAVKLNKTKRDKIRIGPRRLSVAGIIETTGGIDDASVFISLSVLQDLTGQKERINEIRLFPRSSASFESLNKELTSFASVVEKVDSYRGDVAERDVDNTLVTYQKALYAAAFILIAVCIIISTYINLDGRKAEMSTVYTLGARQAIIFRVLTFRTVWITFLGAIVGHVVALTAAIIQEPHVQFQQVWDWTSFIAVISGMIFLGLLVTTPFSVYSVFKRSLIEHL